MKTFKWQSLLALVAVLGIAAACGGSGSGGAPGFPNFPDYGDSGSNGVTEANIQYSFYGEGSGQNRDYSEYLLQESYANIYTVNRSYMNSVPEECKPQAFFKPKCQLYYTGYLNYGAYCINDRNCDWWNPNCASATGAYDCDHYTGKMSIWFEVQNNGKFRIKVQGYYSTMSLIAQLEVKDIDPNDYSIVQSINNGKGVKIKIGGGDLRPNWNKILEVEIDNIGPEVTYSNVKVKYGTVNSMYPVLDTTLKQLPLL